MIARFILRYAWAMWAGGIMAQVGWHWYTWKFYAAIIPLSFLVSITRIEARNEP